MLRGDKRSNISTYLKNILSARYGNDVRQSIHDAIVEVDKVADTAQNSATQSAKQAQESAKTAKSAADRAEQVQASIPEDYNVLSQKVDTIIEKAELNIKNTASGETIHLTDSADSKVVEFGLHGKAEQNGTPTPDAPVDIEVAGASGSVVVKSVGKNLLKNTATSQTRNGITFTVNDDGSVTANGTADTWGATFLVNSIINGLNMSSGNYILNGCPSGGNNVTYRLQFWSNDNKSAYDYGSGATFNFSNTDGDYNVAIIIFPNATINNLTFYPMIRLASDTDDTYEPYTETTATISTPDGLAGINGVYDEVVKYADGSGKRIQRFAKAVFDGSDDEPWSRITTQSAYRLAIGIPIKADATIYDTANILCTHYQALPSVDTYREKVGISASTASGVIYIYDSNYNTTDISLWRAHLAENPITVWYELATPIITDLTAEEIAEIEKLHTFYPVTNISNDADCGMAVTYLADSKNYIDNQLAIQAQAQEEALLNMLLLMPESVQASMIENDTNNLLNEAEV